MRRLCIGHSSMPLCRRPRGEIFHLPMIARWGTKKFFKSSFDFFDEMTFVVWKNRVDEKRDLNRGIPYRFDGYTDVDEEISRHVISFCGIRL